jgi:hypothetical protein
MGREPLLDVAMIEGEVPESPPAGGVEIVLRDQKGTALGTAWTLGERHWIHIRDVATFVVDAGSEQVRAISSSPIDRRLVRDAYYTNVLPIALHIVRGYQGLHASAVRIGDRGVVAFCAASTEGKSTLAYGLSRREGNSLWADDAVALKVGAGSVECIPLPFSVHLRPESAAYFRRDSEPGKPRSEGESEPERLAVLFVVRRIATGSPPAEVVRLPLSEALPALLPHAYFFGLGELEKRRRIMEDYLEIVARIPVFRLGLTAGFDHFSAALDRIEQTLTTAIES